MTERLPIPRRSTKAEDEANARAFFERWADEEDHNLLRIVMHLVGREKTIEWLRRFLDTGDPHV